MKLKVTGKDENGNVQFEGTINKREATFLLNYAINDLLSARVQFYLDESYDPNLDDEDADRQPLRIKTPDWGSMN